MRLITALTALLLTFVCSNVEPITAQNVRRTKGGKAGKKSKTSKGGKAGKKSKTSKGGKAGKKSKKGSKKCSKSMNFNRIATFPICSQISPTCDTDTETNAEIVAVADNGNCLVYTDSPQETVGFVDITDPASPLPAGTVAMPGEPKSVSVVGDLAVVAVNTSDDYVNTSGQLVAVDVMTKTIVKTWDLGGQPDSVTVSPDGKYVVIAIENERDEDLNDGALPQVSLTHINYGNKKFDHDLISHFIFDHAAA